MDRRAARNRQRRCRSGGASRGDPCGRGGASVHGRADRPGSAEAKAAPAEPPGVAASPASVEGVALPELGGTPSGSAPMQAQWIDETEESEHDAADIIEVAPVGEVSAVAAASDEPARRRGRRDRRCHAVGDLYRLLVDEAEGHLATLARELSLLPVRPDATSIGGDGACESHAVRHPSHGRPVADRIDRRRAGAMSAGLQRSRASLPDMALPVLADAVRD